jgi:phosphosulfolactate synthase (CoM biosynthesis protein A)
METVEQYEGHSVLVSTGGILEHVLTTDTNAAEEYFEKCAQAGFHIAEICCGFITVCAEDWIRLISEINWSGPEARGKAVDSAFETAARRAPDWPIALASEFIAAGVDLITLECDAIPESMRAFLTNIPVRMMGARGLENMVFNAADPNIFVWSVNNHGTAAVFLGDDNQRAEASLGPSLIEIL